MVDQILFVFGCLTWRSGYCYLDKGEYNSNQSKDDSFVEWVATKIAETMATATKFMRFS